MHKITDITWSSRQRERKRRERDIEREKNRKYPEQESETKKKKIEIVKKRFWRKKVPKKRKRVELEKVEQ